MAINIGTPDYSRAPLVDNGLGDLVKNALEAYKGGMEARRAPQKLAEEQRKLELANMLAQQQNAWYGPNMQSHIAHEGSGTNLNNANIGLVGQNTTGAGLDNQKKMMAHEFVNQMREASQGGQNSTQFLLNPDNQMAYQYLIGDLPKDVLDVMKENQTVKGDLYKTIQSTDNVITNLNQIKSIVQNSDASGAIGPFRRDLWATGESSRIRGELKPLIANVVSDMANSIGGGKLTNKELELAQSAKPDLKMPYDQFVSALNMNATIAELTKHRSELQLKYITENHMTAADAMKRAQQETGSLENLIGRQETNEQQNNGLSQQQDNNIKQSQQSNKPNTQSQQKYTQTIKNEPLSFFESVPEDGEYLKHLSKENRKIFFQTWKEKLDKSKSGRT